MKRINVLILAALTAALLLSVGCKRSTTPTPSPSPILTATPMPSAAITPEQPATSPDTLASPDTSAGMTIPDFEEGKVVTEADVPDVVKAVTDKYPDAKIKTITMETYEDKQCYHVLLEEAVDGNKDLMVTPDGTVTPMKTDAQ